MAGADVPSSFPSGYRNVRGSEYRNVRGSDGDDDAYLASGYPRATGRSRSTPVDPPGWAPGTAPTDGGPTMAVPVVSQVPVPVRRLVRRVDAWTVFKVSLVFYLLFAVIMLIAGSIAWSVAVHLHFIRDIERAVRTLADKRSFVLHPLPVLEYAAAAFGVLALVGTVLNTVAAVLYNLISDLVGGVQTVEVVEEA